MLVSLGNLEWGGMFDSFGAETADFRKSDSDPEISRQDLPFGRGVNGRCMDISFKKLQYFEKMAFETFQWIAVWM